MFLDSSLAPSLSGNQEGLFYVIGSDNSPTFLTSLLSFSDTINLRLQNISNHNSILISFEVLRYNTKQL
jgi:hypothetical protein